jgi:hypothetical protein
MGRTPDWKLKVCIFASASAHQGFHQQCGWTGHSLEINLASRSLRRESSEAPPLTSPCLQSFLIESQNIRVGENLKDYIT